MDNHLELLKATADKLGIKYAANIGASALESKIAAFEKATADAEAELPEEEKAEKKAKAKAVAKTKPPRKLSNIQVKVMKAKSLSKVMIVNLDSQNTGGNSVTSGVHNMYMDVARVLPLGIPIAVEECLIKEIENRRHTVAEPVMDKNGNHTGNYRTISAPTYAVTRY